MVPLLAGNLVYSAIYAAVGILILNVVKFGNFELLSIHQRRINYAAVIVLATILTVALSYLFEYYVLGEMIAKELLTIVAPDFDTGTPKNGRINSECSI